MKKPTGHRPKPSVTPAKGAKTTKMNKTKPAIKHTSMKSKAGNRSKGGKSY